MELPCTFLHSDIGSLATRGLSNNSIDICLFHVIYWPDSYLYEVDDFAIKYQKRLYFYKGKVDGT